MEKNETKYELTAKTFDETLLILLNEKEYEFITIKEICKKAGFNRSTFYLHYENIDDLLKETLTYKNKLFLSYFKNEKIDLNTSNLSSLKFLNDKYLIPYLKFVKDNKDLFRLSFIKKNILNSEGDLNTLYKEIIYPILTRFDVKEIYKKYYAMFFIEGVIGIIKEWVKRDFKESEIEISSLISSLIPNNN